MKQKGFTIIEAVVATSLFAFVISSIIGVYLATLQLDRKTRAQRAVIQNGRYIMEFLAKEIRNGDINYAAYSGGDAASTTTDLYLTNQAGDDEAFRLNNTDLFLVKSAGSTALNSPSVSVTKVSFLLSPRFDPFTPAKTTNQQPIVTVFLELTANYSNKLSETSKINLEASYTVRSYPSRE
jgi:Tfp pilus assembly protein PilW